MSNNNIYINNENNYDENEDNEAKIISNIEL